MRYKKYYIKPYVVISNGYKYSVTAPDGNTHVGSARTLNDARTLINKDLEGAFV